MTATNSGLNITTVLLLLCLGIMFVGGWYFQSSLVEQRIKVEVQAEKIQQLNKQLDLLQMQHQPTVSWLIPATMYISNSMCICYRVITNSLMNLSILTTQDNML